MTFDNFCTELRVTPVERQALIYHLAAIRARRTVERLGEMRGPRPNANVKPGAAWCAVCEKPIEDAPELRCDCPGGSDEIRYGS